MKKDAYKKEIIRQLLPVSELLTPIIRVKNSSGKSYYFDATADGWTVFYALLDDEEFGSYNQMYVIDSHECIGELVDAQEVHLVPTVHCLKCGRRMFAGTTPEEPDHVVYRCLCGERLDSREISRIVSFDDETEYVGRTITLEKSQSQAKKL